MGVEGAKKGDERVIVQYPDFPPVDGPLWVPRPMVFLLGSYDSKTGAGGAWYAQAARDLAPHAGSAFYGVSAGPAFITWFFHWLSRADLALIWIGPEDCWSEFETGWAIGAFRSESQMLRIGICPQKADLRDDIEAQLHVTQTHVPVHLSLETLLAGARQDLRSMR